jgi:3-oxoacyl-[acyl-carrier-protein] synthase-1
MSSAVLDVCVVAVGARTPLGLTAPSSAAAVRAGVGQLREHPFMVDGRGEPFYVCMDPTIASTSREDRLVALATSAITEVIGQIPHAPTHPLPIFLGLPEPSPGFGPQHVQRVGQRIAGGLVEHCAPLVFPFPDGQASALVALARAVRAVRDRQFYCVVVGGVDSWIDADLLESLDDEARNLAQGHRWGFPPGEGAAMLAVCSPGFAKQYQLRRLGWVASVAVTNEANRARTQTINTGEGLGQAMREAAAEAGARVTDLYGDIDGDRFREHELSYALLRAPAAGLPERIDYVAPATSWGSTGAATGTMLAMLPLLHHARGVPLGPWPMVWCGSDNGRRAAAVFHLEGARR